MTLSDVRYTSQNSGWWMRHGALLVTGLVYVCLTGLGRLIRWALREGWYRPHVALAVAMSTLTAWGIGLLAGPITFVALMLGWGLGQVYRFGRSSGAPGARSLRLSVQALSRAHWRAWRLRRRWGQYAAGFLKAVDGLTGEPPRTRRWQYPSRVRASCVVNVARTGRHIIDDLQPRMGTLAQSLLLHSAAVEPVRGRPGLARFTFYWGSRLEEVVPITELPAPEPGWAWFGLGEDERKAGFVLDLSALLCGESRSGKSTAMWAGILSALEQQGLPNGDPVEFWFVDLALTEFASARPMSADQRLEFARDGESEFSFGGLRYAASQKDACVMLRLLQEESDRRARTMMGDEDRKLRPTEEMPRIILVVDELLRLIDKTTGSLGREAEMRLKQLLTQSAKFGITVWAGTQASQIQVMGQVRDWFQQRAAFSTASTQMTDCALGEGAAAAGATCHQFTPRRDAGRGFMRLDGHGSIFYPFRAAWIDDQATRDIGRGRIPDALLAARGEKTRAEQRPGAVYVMWSHPDVTGEMECLYVGMTTETRPEDRWMDHFGGKTLRGQDRKEWADEVGSVEVLDAGTERGAVRLERQLIRQYRPKYNELRYRQPTEYEMTGVAR